MAFSGSHSHQWADVLRTDAVRQTVRTQQTRSDHTQGEIFVAEKTRRNSLTQSKLQRCNPWPHVANRHISISQLLSFRCHSHYYVSGLRRSRLSQPTFPLWRRSHYNVSRLRRSQPPFSLWRHSRCDVIRYWAGHAPLRSYVRYRHLTAFNI